MNWPQGGLWCLFLLACVTRVHGSANAVVPGQVLGVGDQTSVADSASQGSSANNNQLGAGAIAGIAVGAAVGAGLLGGAAYLALKKSPTLPQKTAPKPPSGDGGAPLHSRVAAEPEVPKKLGSPSGKLRALVHTTITTPQNPHAATPPVKPHSGDAGVVAPKKSSAGPTVAAVQPEAVVTRNEASRYELDIGGIKVSVREEALLWGFGKGVNGVIVNAANSNVHWDADKAQEWGGTNGVVKRKFGKGAYPTQQELLDAGGKPGNQDAGFTHLVKFDAAAHQPKKSEAGLNGIIHALAPTDNDEAALAKCFADSLEKADAAGFTAIRMPLVGTGIFGGDAQETAAIAARAIHKFVQKHPHTQLKDIRLVVQPEKDIRDGAKKIAERDKFNDIGEALHNAFHIAGSYVKAE